jgi:preprotein translocase subunit SecD
VRHAGIDRVGDRVEIRFRDADTRAKARSVLATRAPTWPLRKPPTAPT